MVRGFKFFFLKKKSQGSWPYNNEKKVLITSLQKKKCLKCSFKAGIHSLFRAWLSGLKGNRDY